MKPEWDAWEPEEPTGDFAERVARAARDEETKRTAPVTREPRARRRRVVYFAAAGLMAIALAAVMIVRVSRTDATRGEITADARREWAIGARAIAVLEPGAHVAWSGDDVTQDRGDVFYRVEKRGPFRVHTPAGDVTVQGTCFRVRVRDGANGADSMTKRDVKSGAVGAAIGVMAFVAVYEGKVAVSRAGEHVELSAGEAAQAGGGGVHRMRDLASAERGDGASLATDDPLARANANLADTVREYQERLTSIEAQKTEMQKQLRDAQQRLATAENDGAPVPSKNAYDLSQDDWKELAKTGSIKFQVPCCDKNWQPSADYLSKQGLAPTDAPVLASAASRSRARVWAQIKPLCAQALGGSAEVAEKIGWNTCTHLIIDVARQSDGNAANEAFRLVSEIRAGLRPMPAPGEAINPVEKLFLATTGEMSEYQSELAQSFGPEEAHRLAFGGQCTCSSNFGGPGPREQ